MKPKKLFYLLTNTSNREEFIKLLRKHRQGYTSHVSRII